MTNNDRTTIAIFTKTRDRLNKWASKNMSHDDAINKLLDIAEKEKP